MTHSFEQLCIAIQEQAGRYAFTSREINFQFEGIADVYVLRKANVLMNSGIVIVKMAPHDGPVDYVGLCKKIKFKIAAKVFYIPLLYGFFHQFVLVDENVIDDESYFGLGRGLDTVDNQRSVTQSITLVDMARQRYVYARTKGLALSGRFQDVILQALEKNGYVKHEIRQ
ncbi:MAG: hypothetical protein AAF206_11725 [Bacteroidota bacterium]